MEIKNFTFELVDIYKPAEYLQKELVPAISKSTQGFVNGNVVEYDGAIFSAEKPLADSLSEMAVATTGKALHIDTHRDLGELYKVDKYEFFLTATQFVDYKYRVFFLQYGIDGYPVNVILEPEISRELYGSLKHIVKCESMDDFKVLIFNIVESNTFHSVVQHLIQATVRARQVEHG